MLSKAEKRRRERDAEYNRIMGFLPPVYIKKKKKDSIKKGETKIVCDWLTNPEDHPEWVKRLLGDKELEMGGASLTKCSSCSDNALVLKSIGHHEYVFCVVAQKPVKSLKICPINRDFKKLVKKIIKVFGNEKEGWEKIIEIQHDTDGLGYMQPDTVIVDNLLRRKDYYERG